MIMPLMGDEEVCVCETCGYEFVANGKSGRTRCSVCEAPNKKENAMTTQRLLVFDALPVGEIKTEVELREETGISRNSLPSLLKKMVDDGQLYRVPGVGPRGGFGYWMAVQERKR